MGFVYDIKILIYLLIAFYNYLVTMISQIIMHVIDTLNTTFLHINIKHIQGLSK